MGPVCAVECGKNLPGRGRGGGARREPGRVRAPSGDTAASPGLDGPRRALSARSPAGGEGRSQVLAREEACIYLNGARRPARRPTRLSAQRSEAQHSLPPRGLRTRDREAAAADIQVKPHYLLITFAEVEGEAFASGQRGWLSRGVCLVTAQPTVARPPRDPACPSRLASRHPLIKALGQMTALIPAPAGGKESPTASPPPPRTVGRGAQRKRCPFPAEPAPSFCAHCLSPFSSGSTAEADALAPNTEGPSESSRALARPLRLPSASPEPSAPMAPWPHSELILAHSLKSQQRARPTAWASLSCQATLSVLSRNHFPLASSTLTVGWGLQATPLQKQELLGLGLGYSLSGEGPE